MALSKIDVANMLTGLVPNDNTIRRPNANALIINGDLAVAQRTTSTSSVSSGSNFVSDRFTFGPSTAGTWTISQEAITSGSPFDDGFRTAFKADNTTANGSLSGGSNLQFAQKIEAQDLQVLKYGSSNAEKMTLCFWIKATKTGTNVIEIFGHDSSRSVSVAYTVSTTNTWEKKTVSIPADTGGTINNDNGTGLEVIWWLVAGSNFTSGSLQTAWGANSATARAVGQVNNADSTSNNVHITGVQLEVGEYTSSSIPPFQHESYGDNIARCKRYYQGWGSVYDTGTFGISGRTISSNRFDSATITFIPEMRAAPTVAQGGTADIENYVFQSDGDSITAGSGTSFAALNTQKGSTKFRVTSNATLSANRNANCQSGGGDGKQHLTFTAEL